MRPQLVFRPKIVLVSLIIILMMTSATMVFSNRLDNIVHSDLYRYGLQFSYEWANQYWIYSRSMLVFLGVAMLVAGAAIALTPMQVLAPKNNSIKLVASVLLIMEILMLVLSVFFFARIDNVVHGDLYRYGLQFSYEWANQYWIYSKLMLVFLGVAIGVSGVSFVLNFFSTRVLTPSMKSSRPFPKFNFARLVCYFLISAGVAALAFSIGYNSSILALIGLGLTFWGVLFIYVKPENYVKEILLQMTILPTIANLNQIISELGYNGKAVYLPPKYFKDFEASKVYIAHAREGDRIPLPSLEKTRDEEDRIFIRNPKGALITSPGIELKRFFERTQGIKFTRVDLQYLQRNLPKLLVENLEIAQRVKIECKNNRVFVKMDNSIYQTICKETRRSKIYSRLGCPLCSAIACALAEATGQIVFIEKVSHDDKSTETSYYLFKESTREQTKK